ncbi:Secreted protein, suppressor for copper-sensitivity ScsC [hydrothermal vent metagenome]|uniref:Secreted protein, suppressor for copper-sensitivity ScsC n=1 Tax=hydrothermal vent metagenome TaxID=652676 RepID=A0A1W1CP55_9ZZZZ
MNDESIKKYMKNYIETKMKLEVNQIDIISTYPIVDAPGWVVHFLSIRVKVKIGNEYQSAIVNKTIFTKGNRITVNLMKKGELRRDGLRRGKSRSYTELLKPSVPIDAYDDAHFLLGNKNAPHKILIFSDPYCPYCKKKAVEVVNMVKANSNTYGLYYYHLPLLKIHPAADVTTRAMHIFHKKGEIDKMMKLYTLPIKAKETDVDKILKAIKAKTGVLFTKKQIFSPEIKEAMRVDMAMKRRLQVTGTPTIFLDGKWDRLRKEYKKYAK